jgi:hypothetical protein
MEAVMVLLPTTVPRVKLVEAFPEESELTLAEPTDPPPVVMAKLTDLPVTALPFTSTTSTLGAVETADPAVAD